MEKVIDSVEGLLRKDWIGPQCWQEKVVGFDHIEDRSGRPCELGQNDIERFSDQRQAVSWRGSRQSKFGKDDPMAFKDQWTAVHQGAVEIEDD